MNRITGAYEKSTTLGEVVNAFVPFPLPPTDPELDAAVYTEPIRKAQMALARHHRLPIERKAEA